MAIDLGLGEKYDASFPVAGINQSSQQFRTNFSVLEKAIANLQAAENDADSIFKFDTSILSDGTFLVHLGYLGGGFSLPTGDPDEPTEGMIRYNPDSGSVQFYTGEVWIDLGGGGNGTGGSGNGYSDLVAAVKTLGTVSGSAFILDSESVYVDSTHSIAEKFEQLDANFLSLGDEITKAQADITSEQLVLASQTEALAKQIATVQASFTSAGLDGLLTKVTQAQADIATEETARATADEALASRITTVEADYSSVTTSLTGLGNQIVQANASITDEATARANAIEAVTQTTTTLDTKFTDGLSSANAAIVDEKTARSAADEALTQITTSLSSQLTDGLNTANANITSTQTAVTALGDKIANFDGTDSLAREIANDALDQIERVTGPDGLGWPSISDQLHQINLSNIQALLTADAAARQVKSDVVYALDQTSTMLSAQIADSQASIVAEQEARASQYDALTTTVTALSATIGDYSSAIESERTARADGDSANTLAIDTQTSRLDNLNGTGKSVEATITSIAATQVTENEALSLKIDTLTSTISDPVTGLAASTATLTQAIQTAAGPTSALATSVNALTAQVNDPTTGLAASTASLTNQITAATGPTSSLATQITSLRSTVNNPTTGLAATYASVDTKITAATGPSSSLVSSINSLSGRVGTSEGNITTLQTITNGINARYSVNVSSNGVATGFVLNSNGQTSSFIIQADQFAINSAGVTPFSVVNGVIHMTNVVVDGSIVVGGSITYSQIAQGAVTSFIATQNTNSYVGSGQSSGTGTGGGNFGCVAVESIMPTGEVAGNLQAGDPLVMLNDDRENFHTGAVEAISIIEQPCYRLTTISGITLIASVTTPITLRDGSVISIMKAGDQDVAVLDRGEFRWERIKTLDYLGRKQVALITANDGTYAAGEYPDRYVFTHNKIQQ